MIPEPCRIIVWTFALAVIAPCAPPARAEILITEIMYNPNSRESYPNDVEWVEIYNNGNQPVDISGFYLADEDGKADGLPAGTMLRPGGVWVFIPDKQTADDFHAAWGDNIEVSPVGGWLRPGIGGLANSPSPTNEVLTLCNAGGDVVDGVNFDDEGDWPSDKPDGASIYLLPTALTAKDNDDGRNWARSQPDQRGAKVNRKTEDFDGQDIGSPGHVATNATR